MGFDLNRHWQDPSQWAHPTLHAVKQLIIQMNQDPVSDISHIKLYTVRTCGDPKSEKYLEYFNIVNPQ